MPKRLLIVRYQFRVLIQVNNVDNQTGNFDTVYNWENFLNIKADILVRQRVKAPRKTV